ncbi:MAG: division/cell wall cluster transcriptional repressor MraZ [Sphaerochaetaceae bacterium]|nr:division/cell wall cluster transcriptional repressor MraZ [Sphaerochaetaceae bacterium]
MNGEFRNTLDEKGRLMIPPRIREQLGSATGLMLTKSMDNSLWLFTKEDFDSLDSEINYGPLAMFNKNSRLLDMAVIAPAREVELDKAGRLSIPQVLRDYASLNPKTECVILGSKNHVEILSTECYEKLVEDFKNQISDAGNNLSIQRMGI